MKSLLNKSLLPDEKILFHTRKHWIIFAPPILLTLVAFIFLFYKNNLINIAFLIGIAAAVSWINQILLYITSEFAVTTKRIIMREGFFFKHTNEARLAAIANASVYQSLLGQILNYGTIEIQPFGGRADPFVLIAHPNAFQKHLQMQLDVIK